MDIRSFFSVKKKKTITKESSKKEKNDNDEENGQESSRSKIAINSHSRQKKRKANNSTKTAVAPTKLSKSRKRILESSKNSDLAAKKQKQSSDPDSDHTSLNDDHEMEGNETIKKSVKKEESTVQKQSTTTKTKQKSNDLKGKQDKKIDISAKDFFASQEHKKQKDVSKRSEKNQKNNDDDNDDETVSNDEIDFKKPSSKSKITIDESEEEWKEEEEVHEDHDDDFLDEDDNVHLEKAKKKSRPEPSSIETSPTLSKRKLSSPTKKNSKNKKETIKKPKKILIRPKQPYPKPFTTDDVPSDCLANIKFVLTGIQPNLPRDDMEDFIKILGGRVTKAVSGQTNYLICGKELEDGRGVTEGSKYKRAMEMGEDKITILHGEDEFYGVIKTICNTFYNNSDECDHNAKDSEDQNLVKIEKENSCEKKRIENTSPIKSSAEPNPKKTVVNPYAKRKSSRANTTSLPKDNKPKTTKKSRSGGGRGGLDDEYALWADKYAPSSTKDILGNGENVRKLTAWLNKWEYTFNDNNRKNYGGPPLRAALLSGPPGIGKTTTATLVAEESGREVLEWNASDVRSKKGMEAGLGDVMGSQVLDFGENRITGSNKKGQTQKKKRCIIMDEVDGMGAGDRSGMAELIKIIKTSKVPIICICNDRQSQKIKTLASYCLDLRYRRPVKSVIARRAVEIGSLENMKIEINAAEAIAESCGNDIRQVLNCIQMWSKKIGRSENNGQCASMTYKELKERQNQINKDEMLRVSIFDSTKMIVEGPKGLGHDDVDLKTANKSLYNRCDAFFTDYNFVGLNVHQNYLKVMISQFLETKRSDNVDDEAEVIERMRKATESMSDFALTEHRVRSGDQLWQLLPLCSVLTVKTGHHASGKNGSFLPGFPEFTSWLGKNSSRGKKIRILNELNYHMNYNISADQAALRLYYLPTFREHISTLMRDKEGSKIHEVLDLMDEYGLDRDDLFENIDEFSLDPKSFKLANIDSKVKASFTREFNKRAHKSQALVSEQITGRTTKKKRSRETELTDAKELDAINDDESITTKSDDDADDIEEIKKIFTKKKKQAKGTKKAKESKKKRRK